MGKFGRKLEGGGRKLKKKEGKIWKIVEAGDSSLRGNDSL